MKKDFNEIYEKIYKEFNDFFLYYRIKNIFEIIITSFCVFFLIQMIFSSNAISDLTSYMFFLVLVFFMYLMIKLKKNRIKKLYKRKVINSLITEFDNSFEYIDQMGMSSFAYEESRFNIRFENFKSDDLIIGYLKDSSKISLSEIIVYERKALKNKDNTVRKVEVVKTFQGLYGVVELKTPIQNSIRVSNQKFFDKKLNSNTTKEDFKKIFEVSAVDCKNVLKIFNPELIRKMEQFSEKIRKPFEIEVNVNKVYFRCNCGELFEVPHLSKELDYKMLLNYFEILKYITEIMNEMIANSKK